VITRRTFLASSLFLRASTAQAQTRLRGGTEPTGPVPAPRRVAGGLDPYVVIYPSNLEHNVKEIARRAGGRPILAVIKNNGYGLGVENAARFLEPRSEIAGFAVVKLHEACSLCDAGIKKPILLMGPFLDSELIEEIAPRRIMPMVYRDHGAAFDKAAQRTGAPVHVHVKIDTGMGRVGVPHDEAAPLLRDLATRPSVRLQGVMTTLTEDEAFDREQVQRLNMLADDLQRSGVKVGVRHAASSFALFQNPAAFLDMVRPGMALLGIYSEPQFRKLGLMDLRPAIAFQTRVALVKQLQAGESAGYNRAYVAKAPVWIATLPVGHADGWPRVAAKGARVWIGGRRYPVIASVSASHTLVEIGAERPPEVDVGQIASLFDAKEGSRPEDVAAECGASVYDLTMHLSPLLPRRIAEI
jgi:alanine racemase